MAVTKDLLLEAIREALDITTAKNQDGALTVADLIEATGRNGDKVRRALSELKGQGKLEVVTVFRESLSGANAPRPAYRLKNA